MEIHEVKAMVKLIAQSLRHDPEALGVEVDEQGWVALDDLYEGYVLSQPDLISEEDFHDALHRHNHGKFLMEEGLIRYAKTHTSSKVDYPIREPPSEVLYRTFRAKMEPFLLDEGIQAGKRRYLEVFSNPMEAFKDAKKRRIKNGVIVAIDAHQAYHDGTLFYQDQQKWYVREVSSLHITLDSPEE
jgi:putative RNA 2'-phosphotransferase